MMRTEVGSSLLKLAFRHDPATDLLRELRDEYPSEWAEAVEEVQERRSTTKYGSLVWEAIYEPAACPLRKAPQ
jgi:hypothetical protein